MQHLCLPVFWCLELYALKAMHGVQISRQAPHMGTLPGDGKEKESYMFRVTFKEISGKYRYIYMFPYYNNYLFISVP